MPTPCPLCTSTDRLRVHGTARGGEARTTGICTTCALVQFDERPSPTELAKLYESGAFSDDARGAREPDAKKLQACDRAAIRRYNRLLAHLAPAGPALEVGCGLGNFLFLLRGHGLDVAGIEPDPTYAKRATQWHGISTQAALIEDADLPPGHHGLVALFHVLEHIHDPLTALKQLRQTMRPDGHLYIEVPSVERPYGGDLDRFFWAPHLQSFSTATLAGTLRQAGFAPQAHDHDGDFLWMLATPTNEPAPTPTSPYENPVKRQRILAKAHAVFQHRRARAATHPRRALLGQLVREARKTLDDEPSRLARAVRSKASRVREEVTWRTSRVGRKPWVHYAVPGHAMNSGDTALFGAVRTALASNASIAWDVRNLRKPISSQTVRRINDNARAVVVGGGGLFLRDTVPDSASGWQWNISQAALEALKVPLIVYAVGYNKFRGQEGFDEAFSTHVETTVEKSAFFGLRNHGSIRAIKEYLPTRLHDAVQYQPCPTTVLSRMTRTPDRTGKRPRLALNAAFDRQPNRFGTDPGQALTRIAAAAKHAHASGWDVSVMCHTPEDEKLAPFLRGAGVPFEVQRFYGLPGQVTIDAYTHCDLTIGMRGHAQMIPFGVGQPIMSLVSHEKMQWFLDDVQRPWGVELLHPELTDTLIGRIDEVAGDRMAAKADVKAAQDPLWAITQQNGRAIHDAV